MQKSLALIFGIVLLAYPGISLAAARKHAGKCRELVKQGIDPIEERTAELAPVAVDGFLTARAHAVAGAEPAARARVGGGDEEVEGEDLNEDAGNGGVAVHLRPCQFKVQSSVNSYFEL